MMLAPNVEALLSELGNRPSLRRAIEFAWRAGAIAALELVAETTQEPRPGYRILRDVQRRARKPHDCARCPSMIGVGEPYRELTYVIDGDLTTERSCMRCDLGREAGGASWLGVNG